MNNFIYENGTKVIFGRGCVKEYLSCFLSHYGDHVMLAYGEGSMKRNGIYDELMCILQSEGKKVVEFGGILADPTYAKVLEGAELARENHVDIILAAGGGSVMDCCKAVSLAARYDGDLWADYWAKPGILDFEPVPLCAVVTMAGAGSEMNGSAVIINEELKSRAERDYPKCSPRLALLDPVYTCSVPKNRMVSGGFAILSHMMDIYFREPDEPNVSDDMAEALMRGVIRDLRASIRDPEDYTARSNLMWEAAMAGNRIMKLGKKMDSACRGTEQPKAFMTCSHSENPAVLLPDVYRRMCKKRPAKFRRFALEVWDVPAAGKSEEEIALSGIQALEDFIREIGLPGILQDSEVDKNADLKAVDKSCDCVPGRCQVTTQEEISERLRECS